MIRHVLIPEQREISIDLPVAYIGKRVEIIVFAVDEPTNVESCYPADLMLSASLQKDWLTAEEDHAWKDL